MRTLALSRHRNNLEPLPPVQVDRRQGGGVIGLPAREPVPGQLGHAPGRRSRSELPGIAMPGIVSRSDIRASPSSPVTVALVSNSVQRARSSAGVPFRGEAVWLHAPSRWPYSAQTSRPLPAWTTATTGSCWPAHGSAAASRVGTPMSGIPRARLSPLAIPKPTRRPLKAPGPVRHRDGGDVA